VVNEARRYRIQQRLGVGGFGAVYRAEFIGQGGFTKLVALKVLREEQPTAVEEIARRFRDEARMLGLLRHRAIVHVDGLVHMHGRWVLVMELVEGCNLAEILREPIPLGPAAEIAAEVAAALDAAYRRPGPNGQPLCLLHRDIKPENIQITPHGEVKVLDFGIARADFGAREARTRSLVFGSPGYMAPERLASAIGGVQEDGPAVDIYSLGVVLNEILSARRIQGKPTRPDHHAGRIDLVLDELESRDILGPETSELTHLIKRMLAHAEEDRPSAREVERTLSRIARVSGEMRLLDWAEETVPPIMSARLTKQAREALDDPLVGATLVERSAGDQVEGAPFELQVEPAPVRDDAPPTAATEQASRAPPEMVPFPDDTGVTAIGSLHADTDDPDDSNVTFIAPQTAAGATPLEELEDFEAEQAPKPLPSPDPTPRPRSMAPMIIAAVALLGVIAVGANALMSDDPAASSEVPAAVAATPSTPTQLAIEPPVPAEPAAVAKADPPEVAPPAPAPPTAAPAQATKDPSPKAPAKPTAKAPRAPPVSPTPPRARSHLGGTP